MIQITAPLRLLASLGVVLALVGTAVFVAAAAPAERTTPPRVGYQDDDDDGGNATAPRALPNTGTGTAAGGDGAVSQVDGNATGGNATGTTTGNATGGDRPGHPRRRTRRTSTPAPAPPSATRSSR